MKLSNQSGTSIEWIQSYTCGCNEVVRDVGHGFRSKMHYCKTHLTERRTRSA